MFAAKHFRKSQCNFASKLLRSAYSQQHKAVDFPKFGQIQSKDFLALEKTAESALDKFGDLEHKFKPT